MEVLTFINTYIKYVYILLFIIFIVLIIKIFKKLSDISITTDPILDKVDSINNNLNNLSQKTKIIDNTTKTSIPFFRNVLIGVLLIGSILKDYHETKNSKRSFSKSFKKIYKYKKKIDPNFSISKLGNSLFNAQNR